MTAMRGYTDDVTMQCTGCNALGRICHDAATRTAAAALGAVALVLAAMKRHSRSRRVYGAGCFALLRLAFRHTANQAAIAAAGGLHVVMKALEMHSDSAWVASHACRALWYLAEDSVENAVAIVGLGGVHWVLNTMWEQPEDVDVQRAACGALECLSHVEANRAKMRTKKIYDPIR
jgi:hypothetical protein